MKILLVLATIFATVGAYCPNACSGNGSCGINGKLFSLDSFDSRRFVSCLSSRHRSTPFRPASLSFQTSARVTTVPMVILHGQDMIALYEHVQRERHGHPSWQFPRTMLTPEWNVRTRDFAIVKVVNARALKITMERLANVPCVPTIALDVAFA